MAESVPQTIHEATAAAEAAAKPNVFPVIIASALLLFGGAFVWKIGQAQIEVMQEMAKQIRANARQTQALHDAFVRARIKVVEPAVDREPE